MVPAPSVGRAISTAEGSPSEVAARLATEVIPPSASEQAELLAVPVASAAVVEAQPDEVPPMGTEVTVAAMDGPQPEAVVAAPEAAARPTPPAASEATPVLARTKGVAGEGPSDAAVVTKETSRELSLSLTLGAATRPCGMTTRFDGGVHRIRRR